MEEETSELHLLMVPWLAMGHLFPYFELSKRLANKGIKISFFTTPSNILRLPPIPQTLKHLINFIPCSLHSLDIDNTMDFQSIDADRLLLFQAYDAFEGHLIDYLSDPDPRGPKPNWIIYDFRAVFWAPSLASRFNINSAYFCILNAVAVAFVSRAIGSQSPEEMTTVRDRLPIATTVTFRPFEARHFFPLLSKKRYPKELTLIKTCREFEAKWLDLLDDRYFPVGFIHRSVDDEEETEAWGTIREWLDKRRDFSVVYASFGSEAQLTREQIDEIGLGLEMSGLPFVWVIRVGGSPAGDFAERTAGRGLVWNGWVPQTRLLAHPAIGGFLSHGAWNSIVEGMAVGAPMVVLPFVYEHGLNAQNLVESGYAVEVQRNVEDGSFCGEDIGKKLRMVMVDEEGEELRKKAKQGKEIFGNEKLQDEYIDKLVKMLREKQKMKAQPL